MKVLKHIWPIVLAVIFLIPATGFMFTTHTCNMSNQTSLVFDQDRHCCAEVVEIPVKSCCEEEHQVNQPMDKNGTSGNSSLNVNPEQCCFNESRYLKVDDEYTAPGEIHFPQFEIVFTLALLSDFGQSRHSIDIWTQSHSPPVLHTPREILYLNSALLI